jgi:POT family proton-dependent oligopeptide transporter
MPTKLSEMVKLAKENDWSQEQLAPYLASMPSIGWQFLAYIILTSAEIMVSIVCLEFAYTQSPPKMKSLVMGVYLLGVSIGNFYVSGVNFALGQLKRADGTTPLDGPNYYWFFVGMMLLAFVGYLIWSFFYKGKVYIQGEENPELNTALDMEAHGPQ